MLHVVFLHAFESNLEAFIEQEPFDESKELSMSE
jgi:hypothetical protein